MKNFTKVLLGTFLGVMLVTSTSSAAMTWSRSLKLGVRGADVKDLQMFLNMCADTKVSMSGAGSPGMETTYFGPATKAAVVKWQAARGVMPTSGLFGPLSRAKAAELQASSNVCGGGVVVNPPVGQTGPVMASLSATTPAAGYIIDNQATAGLLDVTFTGSGVVNSVTLKRSGISDQSTLSNVYLYDGVNRLTDGYSFNSSGLITMNNLNLSVNGSRTISVKADVYSSASTSSATVAVALTSFSSGASVNTVNIQGNLMNTASGSTLASATLSSNTVVGSPTVNAGISAYTFWSAPLQVNTRALWLKSAAFRMIGSAPSDALSNIRLYVDGVDSGKVASVMMMNGSNYAVFDYSSMPMSLSTGSHTIDVRANVEKGSSRTVQLSLQQAADLMITDPQVGVNVAVAGTPNSAVSISINAGSLTAVRDSVFNGLTKITGGASNSVIAKYKLHAYGEDIKISSLQVLPVLTSMTPAASGLDNVALYFNGSQVGSQQDWTSGNLTFNLGSQLIVPAGTDSILEVRSDIRTNAAVNYTAGSISANLVVGSSNAQGQSSFTAFNSPALTGNILTVQTGLLALSADAGYASQNANPNTTGVKIGSFVLQNQSSSESVRVTSLQVALAVGAGTSLTNFSGLTTSENATPVQPQATNTFSVDFTIAPGATKTISIFADTSSDSGATATIQSTLTVTSIGATSNVSATSSATAGQTITMRTGTIATPTIVTSSSDTARLIAAAGAGNTDGTHAVFNFSSTNASSIINELTFTVTSGTATSIRVGGVTAPVVGGTAYLTGLNIAVPNGGSGLNLDVFVSYPMVGTGGLASYTASTLTLTTVAYSSGGTAQTPLTALSVAAPTMRVVGSKPAFAVADSTDTLLNGSVKLAEITVSADAKGDIKLSQIAILVNSTGVAAIVAAADNILVKDTSGNTIATTNASFGVAAGGSGTGIICFDTATAACASGQATATGYLIPAGTSKTFRIYATASSVAGAVNTTSLSTKLGAVASTKYYDVAGANSTAIDSALLYGYPTDTSVISN